MDMMEMNHNLIEAFKQLDQAYNNYMIFGGLDYFQRFKQAYSHFKEIMEKQE